MSSKKVRFSSRPDVMSAAHPEAVLWFKRSQRGLFAGRTRLSGNHVSPSKAQCVFLAPLERRRPSSRAALSTLATF
jgi:hypothetical protein